MAQEAYFKEEKPNLFRRFFGPLLAYDNKQKKFYTQFGNKFQIVDRSDITTQSTKPLPSQPSKDRKEDNSGKRMTPNRQQIIDEAGVDVFNFISSHVDTDADTTCLISTTTRFNILHLPDEKYNAIVNFHRVNDIKFINKFFESVNSKLQKGDLFLGCGETRLIRKEKINRKFPYPINNIYLFLDYLLKRVFPKLSVPTRRIYFFLTKGRGRALSRTEVLGRLISCGFDFVDEKYVGGMYWFVMKKVGEPQFPENPSYGPLFKMRRVGKGGKIIHVYKLRTMYPYSEYLQKFVYERNDLAEGGKLGDDFRVTTAGKLFRKFWIDELPMIINLLKGDLKIVGVRPLSQHYLSLYTAELREIRLKHKPGLVPPFYADLPKTLDEIMDSEMRYLKAYEQSPILTDIKYFFKSFYNIVIKKARSK